MQNIIYLAVLSFFLFHFSSICCREYSHYDASRRSYCPLIAQLEGQLKTGNKGCLEKFWEEVRLRTTPLIDQIQGNDYEMLVTFIWQARKDHKNVVVASYGISSFDPCKNAMVHLPGTDVCYKGTLIQMETFFQAP